MSRDTWNTPKILADMHEFLAQFDFLIGIGSAKMKPLDELLTAERARVLVELGGYLGYSAILCAGADAHTWLRS
ncbi:putative catechol O-methyltransferase 2 [Cytospora mali]|uniref:Catechol O-methyltransferase 2 n=1 Tax=Cytospora mali TaxID=578113 RepID=A0A194V0L8_CYTMA|nr:putative catechol O-methyltransferase 2 [Valsa mali var. pyri (nom. inval.)]